MREKPLLPATFVKFAQTCLFLFSKAKAQVFPVIAAAKIVVEIYLFGDQAVDVGYVFIAYFAEAVREGLEVANFRSNQPERVYKWKTDKLVPLFAKVPEMKFPGVFFPETDSLIADQ